MDFLAIEPEEFIISVAFVVLIIPGHYIPQLAALLLEYNKLPNTRPINLKAIAVSWRPSSACLVSSQSSKLSL